MTVAIKKVQSVPQKVRIVPNGLLSFVNALYNVLYFSLKKGLTEDRTENEQKEYNY